MSIRQPSTGGTGGGGLSPAQSAVLDRREAFETHAITKVRAIDPVDYLTIAALVAANPGSGAVAGTVAGVAVIVDIDTSRQTASGFPVGATIRLGTDQNYYLSDAVGWGLASKAGVTIVDFGDYNFIGLNAARGQPIIDSDFILEDITLTQAEAQILMTQNGNEVITVDPLKAYGHGNVNLTVNGKVNTSMYAFYGAFDGGTSLNAIIPLATTEIWNGINDFGAHWFFNAFYIPNELHSRQRFFTSIGYSAANDPSGSVTAQRIGGNINAAPDNIHAQFDSEAGTVVIFDGTLGNPVIELDTFFDIGFEIPKNFKTNPGRVYVRALGSRIWLPTTGTIAVNNSTNTDFLDNLQWALGTSGDANCTRFFQAAGLVLYGGLPDVVLTDAETSVDSIRIFTPPGVRNHSVKVDTDAGRAANATLKVETLGSGNFKISDTTVALEKALLTTSAPLVTGNSIALTVNGVAITPVPFNTNNDTTLADLATEIALNPEIDTAVVTEVAGDDTDDREIIVTALNEGVAVVLTGFLVTGGASQPTAVISPLLPSDFPQFIILNPVSGTFERNLDRPFFQSEVLELTNIITGKQSMVLSEGSFVETSSSGTQVFTSVVNRSGSIQTKGSAVRISGDDATTSKPKITQAQATTVDNAQVLGLLRTDLVNNQVGDVLKIGRIEGINTSLFSENDTLYLSVDSPGELTNVKPVGVICVVGNVGKVDPVNGSINMQIERPTGSVMLHGEMIQTGNSAAYKIKAVSQIHAYHSASLAAGELNGMTFDPGQAGADIDIVSISDFGGGKILVATNVNHNLLVGDVLSQVNLTDLNYRGVFLSKDIPSPTTYTVVAPFAATGAGQMDKAATLTVDDFHDGKYNLNYNINANAVSNNTSFVFRLFLNATPIMATNNRINFGTGVDFKDASAHRYVNLVAGDKISLGLLNRDTTGDIVFEKFTQQAERF